MTTALLVGAGAVGRRTARQLAETPGVERVLVVDKDHAKAKEVAGAIGEPVEAIAWTPAGDLPSGVDVVAVAAEGLIEPSVAERAIEAGIPAACCAGDPHTITALLELGAAAASAGVTIAAGCGLAPGLTDVLARHAADALDEVSEMLVARCGSAGPACRDNDGQRSTDMVDEWRSGGWVRERAGSGRSLVWFPDPVGGQDCRRAASGQVALLVDAFPGLQRASMRLASEPANPSGKRRGRARPDPDGEWGAVWVEVRGRRARSEELMVYGAVDRVAFASAAVLATATAGLAGGSTPVLQTGAHGLGALFDPVPFLAELSRRGVQAATFEGARF